jgi:MarR family 2-MHQ and catechol resistance regulon transcriptional repressor
VCWLTLPGTVPWYYFDVEIFNVWILEGKVPTHYQGNAKEVRALNTFIKLTRSVESLLTRLDRRGTIGDLTASQFGVLESLYHLGPMCLGEVSTKLLKSGGNITLVVDNLEKQGLVKRERSTEDRRRVVVSLTKAGRAIIERIFPGHVAAIVEELSVLTLEEQELLGRLCRKLGKQASDTEAIA